MIRASSFQVDKSRKLTVLYWKRHSLYVWRKSWKMGIIKIIQLKPQWPGTLAGWENIIDTSLANRLTVCCFFFYSSWDWRKRKEGQSVCQCLYVSTLLLYAARALLDIKTTREVNATLPISLAGPFLSMMAAHFKSLDHARFVPPQNRQTQENATTQIIDLHLGDTKPPGLSLSFFFFCLSSIPSLPIAEITTTSRIA